MKAVLLVLLVLLLLASSASAQSLKLPLVVWTGAVTSDWASTAVALRRHQTEINPTLRWASSPSVLVAAGAVEDLAGLVLAEKLLHQRHRKALVVGLYAVSAWRVFLAVHNFSVPDRRVP
jgi:hypothetical protein